MSTTRILLVSSVTPKPTGFGEITLHRHLTGDARLEVEVVQLPEASRAMRLLWRTPLVSLIQARYVREEGRRWDVPGRAAAAAFKPDVILTIAAGDGCHAALRLARELALPLVTIFHDWWPDLVPASERAAEEVRFRALYEGSAIALCVSEGMRRALGEHPDSRLLWPIPGKPEPVEPAGAAAPGPADAPFKICYSGNLREYAAMLQKALQALRGHKSVRLEVRGMAPRWPAAFRDEMLAAGTYHEFAPREELEGWLRSADAFLVTTAFEPEMRRMMETNFPSKLLEFARFGRPLVAWGPEYSSLIRWAQPAGRACCVTDPDPAALIGALEQLAASPGERARLGHEATAAMHREFDPALLQEQFVQAMGAAASHNHPRPAPAMVRQLELK
jgi:glycosyltransferase involved in cell wall biosynthesis